MMQTTRMPTRIIEERVLECLRGSPGETPEYIRHVTNTAEDELGKTLKSLVGRGFVKESDQIFPEQYTRQNPPRTYLITREGEEYLAKLQD